MFREWAFIFIFIILFNFNEFLKIGLKINYQRTNPIHKYLLNT